MKNFRKSALFVIVSLALSACYKHLPEEGESVTDGSDDDLFSGNIGYERARN